MKNITSKKEKVNIETIKIVQLPWGSKLASKLKNKFKKLGIKTILFWDII